MTRAWALANVGARSFGGQLGGEPTGIPDITINHEQLVIDMRPLAGRGAVAVAVTYHLDNSAAEKKLELLFASGSSEIADFLARLDGRPVASRRLAHTTLPEAWRAPESTPLPGGGELAYEVRGKESPEGFELDVPPGRHELAISYAAQATMHHHDGPTLMRQFAYVLAPARTWAGFGGLDLTVQLPPGWSAGVAPALARDGDTLHGAFPGVPADAVAISVCAPTGAFGTLRTCGYVLCAIVLVGGAVGLRARAGRLRAGGDTIFARVGLGVAWGGAFFAAGLLALLAPDLALPEGQADHYGYELLVAGFALAVGSVVMVAIGALIATRRRA